MATHDYRDNPDYSDPYWEARYEHAYRLRVQGLTYRIIGERLGVGSERARQMVDRHTWTPLKKPYEPFKSFKSFKRKPRKRKPFKSYWPPAPPPVKPIKPLKPLLSVEELQLQMRREEMAAFDRLGPLSRQALREVTLAISARAAWEYYVESGFSDLNTADMVHQMDRHFRRIMEIERGKTDHNSPAAPAKGDAIAAAARRDDRSLGD